jgi:hypothetical protein
MALCSPSVLAETGLTICLAEKCQTVNAFDAEQSVLCSPVCSGLTAKYGHYSGILVESRRAFSAVKTEWRRKEDSNLQYLFETCKSRRVRNLQGIKSFKNSPRLPARRAVVLPMRFLGSPNGGCPAILWLKVVSPAPPDRLTARM